MRGEKKAAGDIPYSARYKEDKLTSKSLMLSKQACACVRVRAWVEMNTHDEAVIGERWIECIVVPIKNKMSHQFICSHFGYD